MSGPDGEVELTWDPNGPLPQPVAVTTDTGTDSTATGLAWGAAGAPAWADVDGTLQVSHADQVWNPIVATDGGGVMTHHWTRDSWGANRTVTSMDPAAPSPTVGFSSTIDAAAAAGLVHMRARDYDPATGQFLTPDPWVRPDGQPWVGVHAYVDGNPVSSWDPDGLRPKHPIRNAFNNMRGWIGSAAGWIGRRLDTSVQLCVPFEMEWNCIAAGQQGGNFYWQKGRGVGMNVGASIEFVPIDYEDRSCRNLNAAAGPGALSGGQDGKFPFDIGVGGGPGIGAAVTEWHTTDSRHCKEGVAR